MNLRTSGGKFTILERIAHLMDTGAADWPGDVVTRPTSRFDWQSAPLTRDTVLTDSYKNTQNVRRFFAAELGDGFKFNIAFMDWLKVNAGRTLAEAIDAYREIEDDARDPARRTQIKPHNQFNQYTRDFLDDNPGASMGDVRRIWALKRQRPSETGRHIYERSDLELTDDLST